MANTKSYKMDPGAWLSADKTKGVGRETIDFTAPSWNGREDRLTVRIVRKNETGSMKAVTIRQKGVKINNIPVERIEFPIQGGSKQILVTTNAASLNALITSDSKVKSYIKAFTTATGLNIDVNDVRLDYGFPGDPGLEDTFQVSIIVSIPDNSNGDEVNENITINGKLISIHQPSRVIPYIKFDKEFEQIEGDVTSTKLSIESNIEDYTIEIIECEFEDVKEINLDKQVINLNSKGDAETLRVSTKPANLGWRIQ